jgi:hypothetical protein
MRNITMKNVITFLLVFAGLASAKPVPSRLIIGNMGQSLPLFSAQPNAVPVMGAVLNLDTSEIDTGYYFYQLLDKPITGSVDTVGYLHFAAKDSSGTDSARVRVIWYGNSRVDGLGIWTKIDSVTYSATSTAASAWAAGTPTPVVNSKAYSAFMFTVGNPSNSAVALKSAAKDIVLNRRERLMAVVPQ